MPTPAIRAVTASGTASPLSAAARRMPSDAFRRGSMISR